MKKVAVIGGGFAGLSAACSLAQRGYSVTLFEKNESTGGRGRSFEALGFTFDMGPSWYWMPEVFSSFFERFGKRLHDYYELVRLDPSYRVFFSNDRLVDIPADYPSFRNLLEEMEPGCGPRLDKFIAEAKTKYDVSMQKFVWKPSLTFREFLEPKLLVESFRLQLFSSFRKHAEKYFSNPEILKLMEFPILFLGAKPENTPAMYSMMNYADIVLGTWYPKGGMFKIAEAMTKLAEELGVHVITSATIQSIVVDHEEASHVDVNGKQIRFDAIVAAADYHHVEMNLLQPKFRSYSDNYWEKRVMSPSSLIFYLGINKKVEGLLHHNLFFDESFDEHAKSIYDNKEWPQSPLFYLCCPSKTDNTVAPKGKENLFILIPVATGLSSTEKERDQYLDMCLDRIEKKTGVQIRDNIEFKRSYAHEEFVTDYNSFKGNAYGLANTLMQTAIMKPRMKSKKVKNLFYAGQLTVPGPGVPPSIISGQIAANEVVKFLERKINSINS